MGVPAFFRWLTRKYPSVIVNAVEEKPRDVDGNEVPIRTTEPNPNFQEFDNLYLDMNGIIHPCTHPENRPAPKNEDEILVLMRIQWISIAFSKKGRNFKFQALIFEYIDRIFAIVRPRRLLYMAIDGVAPRAKMNQQRSRRFRASKEAAEKAAQIAEVRERLEREGYPLPPKKEDEEHFDSNCITPGTPFMARLADALRYYVHVRLNNDPGWENIEVILSDANAPGEGEHKIMDFIRRQRASPSHDPNTVHCLCGADADLIMLGLATHEPNFNIIREEFIPNQQRPCELCGQYGHELKECQGLAQDEIAECESTPMQRETNFIFVRLPVLREYLEKELQMNNLSVPFDLERAIDDWVLNLVLMQWPICNLVFCIGVSTRYYFKVFMCFFVGNDFLPHLPSLEIRENAIDRLIALYKDMVARMGGYLTNQGDVHMDRVQKILNGLGEVEDEIFKTRQQKEVFFRERNKARRRRERAATTPAYIPGRGSLLAPQADGPVSLSGAETRRLARDARVQAMEYNMASNRGNPNEAANQGNRKRKMQEDSEEEEIHDEVRLWEDGWKGRYYRSKFQVDGDDIEFRHRVAWAYVEGLCWVLKYYYQGCASWNWYFPYHYAPFASDFDTISEFKPDFSAITEPFKPLEQLMAVFPAASKKHLPETWQHLMTDDESPIIDFYPEDFQVDLNGKKYAWQGVALLPFVDESRLLETLKTVYETLDAFERERNSRGPDRIFVGPKHPFAKFLQQLYEGSAEDAKNFITLDAQFTNGMAGDVAVDPKVVPVGKPYPSPVPLDCCPSIQSNHAIMAIYQDPQFDRSFVFSTKRLPGAKEVPRTLKPSDWNPNESYRPQIGFSRNVPRGQLADAGHRMIAHEMSFQRNGPSGVVQVDKQWRTDQRRFNRAAPYPQQQQQHYNSGGGPSMNPPDMSGYHQSRDTVRRNHSFHGFEGRSEYPNDRGYYNSSQQGQQQQQRYPSGGYYNNGYNRGGRGGRGGSDWSSRGGGNRW
ncbi:unnamed protein product [Anisakis simplex]|uniref:5'-3' exoribonuclease n=1 Tax=Anisakis simplex TaxID=6269 RepID=A0A158PPI1_ANISI|nr:unnamed protein product [Anisakis simplex]